jgi:acryloyl-coenzyme A reductase
MRAAVVTEPGPPEALQLTEVPVPRPGPLEVLIKVGAVGVCGQDHAIRSGLVSMETPFIPGHEIAGVVAAVGPKVTRFGRGDRVACKQFVTCGACQACRSGADGECGQRVHVYGGYGEYAAIGENALLAIPEDIDEASASIVACAIGTTVQALSSIAEVRFGEQVVIIGAGGGLGIHAIQVVRALGAIPVAVTTSPGKARVMTALGANAVLDSRDPEFVEALIDATNGGPHVVLDNVGLSEGFKSCFRALRQRGRYVFLGQLYRERVDFYPAFILHKEAIITGSSSTTMASFMTALQMVAERQVKPVIETFPLDRAVEVHERTARGEITGRAVLVPRELDSR